MKTLRWFLSGAAVVLVAAGPVAAADRCVRTGRAEFRECTASCREALQSTADSCVSRDHECVEVCRAEREDCRDATGYDAAVRACNATREAAVVNCRALYPAGPDRDTCIDDAQVAAFACRDLAREDHKPALEACRERFRACARACPPPDASATPARARRCRRDARREYRACLKACGEEFQVARDGCRNLDHGCVEDCRSARVTCVRPVLQELDTALAACRTTRDAAVATCNSTFPAGSADLDRCIDQAQLVAFQCRDTAHEQGRPGFKQCSDAFRACAAGCPPASPSGAFLD